jgi:hypothetical protein
MKDGFHRSVFTRVDPRQEMLRASILRVAGMAGQSPWPRMHADMRG